MTTDGTRSTLLFYERVSRVGEKVSERRWMEEGNFRHSIEEDQPTTTKITRIKKGDRFSIRMSKCTHQTHTGTTHEIELAP